MILVNNKKVYDVVVIGGGVVGTSILRNLSLYEVDIALIEKQNELGEGASKANSGIIHTGFDAPPGSIEAKCLAISRDLWPEILTNLKIPYLPCGAVMVATSQEEVNIIEKEIIPNAVKNGVDVELISREELFMYNPALSEDVICGLAIPNEFISDPFRVTVSFAEQAVLNGAKLYLGNGVNSIKDMDDYFLITLENGETVKSEYIVNAAGLYSDEISRMIGDQSYSITPRKGEFILTEEKIDISQIILPVPTPKSKGKLVSPIVFGGFLLGPTAVDQDDKQDKSTTDEGLEEIIQGCESLVSNIKDINSIRQFAGIRAVCSEGDFVIKPSEINKKFIHSAGIRSTGLSASPGIAVKVLETLEGCGLALREKSETVNELPDVFEEGESAGEIVCICRSVTKGEIMNALKSPVPPITLDGLKRRSGASFGKCQGNCCIPRIMDIMKENNQLSKEPIKNEDGSYIALEGGNIEWDMN